MIAAILLIILLLLFVLWLLLRRRAREGGSGSQGGTGTGTGQGGTTTGTGQGAQPAIPDQIAGADVAGYIAARLAGTPADGSTAINTTTPAAVVWLDGGDEVLVHLASVQSRIAGSSVLVSIDLETDQTGRTPLVVAFSLGQDENGALIAATDEFPRGNGVLAARWGVQVQEAAWNALLLLAGDHATERGLNPRGLTIQNGALQLHAGPLLTLS